MEAWKNISGYGDRYQISNLARVRAGEYIKTQQVSTTGYYTVNLFSESKAHMVKVHRLVALAFIPNPRNKRCVNHKDGDKLNNAISNLEWATHSENMIHAFKVLHNKPLMGEDCGRAKLSRQQVLRVIELHGAGVSQRKIAAMVGNTSRRNIRSIINGDTWKHISRTATV